MIEVKEGYWATEQHLKELDRKLNGHKVSWFKRLKALIKGKAEVPSKPKERFTCILSF